jgi:branched-chain amino acid aminotransferase
VLELCARNDISCEVRDVSTSDVYGADEMFCTGTMGELAWVRAVDGHAIGLGGIGPVTTRLGELFKRETESSGYAVLDGSGPGSRSPEGGP